jgi:hypothetical protein
LVEFELVGVVAGHDGEGGREVLGVPAHEGDAEEPVPVGVARRRTVTLVGHNAYAKNTMQNSLFKKMCEIFIFSSWQEDLLRSKYNFYSFLEKLMKSFTQLLDYF